MAGGWNPSGVLPARGGASPERARRASRKVLSRRFPRDAGLRALDNIACDPASARKAWARRPPVVTASLPPQSWPSIPYGSRGGGLVLGAHGAAACRPCSQGRLRASAVVGGLWAARARARVCVSVSAGPGRNPGVFPWGEGRCCSEPRGCQQGTAGGRAPGIQPAPSISGEWAVSLWVTAGPVVGTPGSILHDPILCQVAGESGAEMGKTDAGLCLGRPISASGPGVATPQGRGGSLVKASPA